MKGPPAIERVYDLVPHLLRICYFFRFQSRAHRYDCVIDGKDEEDLIRCDSNSGCERESEPFPPGGDIRIRMAIEKKRNGGKEGALQLPGSLDVSSAETDEGVKLPHHNLCRMGSAEFDDRYTEGVHSDGKAGDDDEPENVEIDEDFKERRAVKWNTPR